MKSSAKKILSITLTAVLLFCSFQAPIPSFGPRLSDAATELVATQTDVTLQPIPGEEAEPTATLATKVKNIVATVAIIPETPAYNVATANLSCSANAVLHWYNKMDITPQQAQESVYIDWTQGSGQTRELEVYVSGNDNIADGTQLIQAGFTIAATVANPLNYFTFSADGTTPEYQQLGSIFECHMAVLGDVNQDAAIDSSDSLMILNHANGKFPITDPAKLLAADVTMDGSVDATDSMRIQQYSVDNILTFWNTQRVYIPSEAPAGITSGNVYRLENKQDGRYLRSASTSTTCTAYLSTYSSTTLYPKFQIVLDADSPTTSPFYNIKNLANGQNMMLTTGYKTTFNTTEAIANSDRWYLIRKSGNDYWIVNAAVPAQTLSNYGYNKSGTSNCGVSYLDLGNIWTLHGPSVTINYYYDNGYYSRYSTDGVSDINDYQGQISTILSNVFGVDVTLGAAGSAPTTSLADGCTASVGSLCSDSGRTNATCIANCETSPYTNVHHKNANALLLSWYDSMTTAQRGKIHVMFSGHAQCKVDNDGTHKENTLGGTTYINRRVAVVYSNDPEDRESREKLTALHEISHDLGASSSNGALVDDNHSQEPEDINCIMSYERINSQLLDDFNSSNAANHRALYCDDCYDHIVDYLNKYY